MVKRAIEEGYRSIKLKIGRRPIEEDIELVKSVYKIISKKADLRLDTNQAWDLPTAIQFVKGTQDCTIEYIEEPLQDPVQLAMLHDQTGIPVAVDESISGLPLSTFQVKNWMKALVLKPAVIGSVQDTLEYIRIARQSDLKIVISDTFHSGVGLSFLIRLATFLTEMLPMGFDTYQWLAEDILSARLSVSNGSFDWQNVRQSVQKINFSRLHELSGSLSIDSQITEL
jgi:O-succinylbenzoate synthase